MTWCEFDDNVDGSIGSEELIDFFMLVRPFVVVAPLVRETCTPRYVLTHTTQPSSLSLSLCISVSLSLPLSLSLVLSRSLSFSLSRPTPCVRIALCIRSPA